MMIKRLHGISKRNPCRRFSAPVSVFSGIPLPSVRLPSAFFCASLFPASALSAAVFSAAAFVSAVVPAAVHSFFAAPVLQQLFQKKGKLLFFFLAQAGEKVLHRVSPVDLHLRGGFQAGRGEGYIHASFILFIGCPGDIAFRFHFPQDFTQGTGADIQDIHELTLGNRAVS